LLFRLILQLWTGSACRPGRLKVGIADQPPHRMKSYSPMHNLGQSCRCRPAPRGRRVSSPTCQGQAPGLATAPPITRPARFPPFFRIRSSGFPFTCFRPRQRVTGSPDQSGRFIPVPLRPWHRQPTKWFRSK